MCEYFIQSLNIPYYHLLVSNHKNRIGKFPPLTKTLKFFFKNIFLKKEEARNKPHTNHQKPPTTTQQQNFKNTSYHLHTPHLQHSAKKWLLQPIISLAILQGQCNAAYLLQGSVTATSQQPFPMSTEA